MTKIDENVYGRYYTYLQRLGARLVPGIEVGQVGLTASDGQMQTAALLTVADLLKELVAEVSKLG